MKTTNPMFKCLARCGLFLAVAGLVALPAGALAQKGDGAAKLIQLKPVQLRPIATVADAQAVKHGDMVVMACPKCKDTWVTVIEKSAKTGAKAESRTYVRHECPGCSTKFVTEGHGKGKTDKLVHTCKQCGSKDASCCVMKKGTGPTRGMEKK